MKNKKIIITGGLGYIGTELCKLYSGIARTNNIIVLDNRFFSKRVKQLRDWGIEYVQGDILDETILQKLLPDTDIIHHLAGVTDVAYTKTEATDEKDKQIVNVGIQGSKNIIKYAPADCKIIFPSTHVVFEGLSETTFDIDEDVQTMPILTYSKGKVQTENDLIESGKNYVILRLGSNYGLSEDNMRINIMPNLFSKFSSQNNTLRLFSKGIQYKSLVAVKDVARCLKFVSEEESINKQIYNCTNENMSVAAVAALCKKYNPLLNLIETDDEVPNLGYTLSNKKILSTGFKFLYNIEESIKEMIYEWSAKDISKEIEYVVGGGNNFTDNRGLISNYELSEPINLIGYIESKSGTIRANHYHPIQEQKVLLISGEYISVCQDLLIENSPKITKLIKPGDLVVTRPNVAHTMVFSKNSVLLNLVNGERKHENYGITHTINYPIVNEEEKLSLISTYKKKCRSCNSENHLKRFISLGWSPLANNLIDSIDEKIETFPLEVDFCEKCFNSQLSVVVPPEKMFDNYLYKSSIGKSFVKHFEDAAEKYIKDFNLNENSLIIDIGSNDGISLMPFKNKGMKVLGIEPARNIAKEAIEKGIDTISGYFESTTTIDIIKQKYLHADIITASNVFAHSDELKTMVKSILGYNLLKQGGQFIVEVQYLYDTINDLTFDNIYHEHVNYWSVSSFVKFINGIGQVSGNKFSVTKVEHINTHGGSVRLYMTLHSKESVIKVDESVNEFLVKENEFGLTNSEIYIQFGKQVEKVKEKVNANFSLLQKQFKNICGYGAPAKATTALNFFGINGDKIKYIIEDNVLKHNKYIPGVNIPIYSKDKLKTDSPDLVIVMAWNFFDDIVKNNKHLFGDNTVFISIKDLEKDNVLNKTHLTSVG